MSDPVALWTAACQSPVSSIIAQSLLRFMCIESVMLFNHLILCTPFSFCLQSFPASGSFPVSWLFASCGQNIGTSVSVLLLNILGWFPLELAGLISLQSKGLSRVFSNTIVQKHQFFGTQPSLCSNCTDLVGKVMSVLFNMLSRFVRAFLPRNKRLLISQLQSLSTVILEPMKIN